MTRLFWILIYYLVDLISIRRRVASIVVVFVLNGVGVVAVADVTAATTDTAAIVVLLVHAGVAVVVAVVGIVVQIETTLWKLTLFSKYTHIHKLTTTIHRHFR